MDGKEDFMQLLADTDNNSGLIKKNIDLEGSKEVHRIKGKPKASVLQNGHNLKEITITHTTGLACSEHLPWLLVTVPRPPKSSDSPWTLALLLIFNALTHLE